MKQTLKIILGLLVGAAIGLLIGMLISRLTGGLASHEGSWSPVGVALVALASFIVSWLILIPIHEGGHLICGLLTGYKFVSFRIGNLVFIKEKSRIKAKQFGIAGTGGQCLLVPPEGPLEQIPTSLYNAGGVLANLVVLLIAVGCLWIPMHPLIYVALLIFIITNAFMIILNGVPMKINGMGNDGYNALHMSRNVRNKRALMIQLQANALVQNGMRPREMPKEMFEFDPNDIKYSNPLEIAIPNRLLDLFDWEGAYSELEALFAHKDEIMQLYRMEIACELAFCAMLTGRFDRAREVLDKDVMKNVNTYSRMMSSKKRLLIANVLLLGSDRAAAEQMYEDLMARRDSYLIQGEVKSDLAILESLFNRNN